MAALKLHTLKIYLLDPVEGVTIAVLGAAPDVPLPEVPTGFLRHNLNYAWAGTSTAHFAAIFTLHHLPQTLFPVIYLLVSVQSICPGGRLVFNAPAQCTIKFFDNITRFDLIFVKVYDLHCCRTSTSTTRHICLTRRKATRQICLEVVDGLVECIKNEKKNQEKREDEMVGMSKVFMEEN
jgi:hypothetical protein